MCYFLAVIGVMSHGVQVEFGNLICLGVQPIISPTRICQPFTEAITDLPESNWDLEQACGISRGLLVWVLSYLPPCLL